MFDRANYKGFVSVVYEHTKPNLLSENTQTHNEPPCPEKVCVDQHVT